MATDREHEPFASREITLASLRDRLPELIPWLRDEEYAPDFHTMLDMLHAAVRTEPSVVVQSSAERERQENKVYYPRDAQEAAGGLSAAKETFFTHSQRIYVNNYRFPEHIRTGDFGVSGDLYSLELVNQWIGDDLGQTEDVLRRLRAIRSGSVALREQISETFYNIDNPEVRDRAIQNLEGTEAYIDNLRTEAWGLTLKRAEPIPGRGKTHFSILTSFALAEEMDGEMIARADYYRRVDPSYLRGDGVRDWSVHPLFETLDRFAADL